MEYHRPFVLSRPAAGVLLAAMRFRVIIVLVMATTAIQSSWDTIQIGRLRYQGGGDWYSNPSSLPNLMRAYGKATGARVARRERVVSLADESFKQVPLIYFTGHGKFQLTATERENLRWYLRNGGFLFADDNFGMDKYVRKELNSIFPGTQIVELPSSHPLFKKPHKLPLGMPKIHKHYGGPARAYGLFLEDRMVAFYGFNTDLGDGWEDIDVHNDGKIKHEQALQMGVNVIHYALSGGLF